MSVMEQGFPSPPLRCTCSCCTDSEQHNRQRRKLSRGRKAETSTDNWEDDHYNDSNYHNDPPSQDFHHPCAIPWAKPTPTSAGDFNQESSGQKLFTNLMRNLSGRRILSKTGNHISTLTCILVILSTLLSCLSVQAFPTNDCDWRGSGTPENVVQAVYLRCQQGHIVWERPRGGLRVNISPPKYFTAFGQRDKPFRLCLETSSLGSNFQVFLEQITLTPENEVHDERRKLLPFISPKKKSSTCYRIGTPTATLYVESQNVQEEAIATPIPTTTATPSSQRDAYQVKIFYEIEELKESQEGVPDDECRPCSDQEVLQLYCVADVVARGEILSVRPSAKRKGMDTLHIKSNLLVHQNFGVFQPLKAGNKNLQKFMAQEIPTFDANSPDKITSPGKSRLYGGIVSHPSKCAAQSGPGEFLWLIKLSFGRPKIGCVLYWDKWTELAAKAEKAGTASCSFVH